MSIDTDTANPDPQINSPLDVEPVDLDITTEEIVEIVREGRERD
mgnify:CR=1 FL=1